MNDMEQLLKLPYFDVVVQYIAVEVLVSKLLLSFKNTLNFEILISIHMRFLSLG